MTQETQIKLFLFRYDIDDNKVSSEPLEIYSRELLWLFPSECQVYSPLHENYSDIIIPEDSDVYGTGGGSGVDVVQLLICFLEDEAVIIAIITAITTVVSKFLERGQSREITIEIGNRKFSSKGLNKINQDKILGKLFPEISDKGIEAAPSRLERHEPRATINIKSEITVTEAETNLTEGKG